MNIYIYTIIFALGVFLLMCYTKKTEGFARIDIPTETETITDGVKETPWEDWLKNDDNDALKYYNNNVAPEKYDSTDKTCDTKCRISTMMSKDCFAGKYNYCTLGNYEMSPNNRYESCDGRCRFDCKYSKSNCCIW